MLFVDPWFLLAILPAVLAAYSLVHALSTTTSAWLLLAVSAAIVARTIAHPLTIAVIACHAIAGAVDLQRGRAVIRRAWTLALYLIQFPLLAGGPLVRYAEFSGQLARRNVGMAAFAYGVRRVVTGLVKLLLIAEVLRGPIDRIFNLPPDKTHVDVAWFGAACFALQVYFQFSGYADMAIGLGRMLGFRYPENFRRPFTADSLREFWRRWNVTLITWLRRGVGLPRSDGGHGQRTGIRRGGLSDADGVDGVGARVRRRRAARAGDQPVARLGRRRHDLAADDARRDRPLHLAPGSHGAESQSMGR